MIRLIKRLVRYCFSKAKAIFKKDYQWYIVNDDPKTVNNRDIYIIKDGDVPDTILLKCPCGCDATIQLNLLPDAKPKWNYTIGNKKEISIFPSIWRNKGCKSHFFIKKSKVVWS